MKYNVRDEDGIEYKVEEIETENSTEPLDNDNEDNNLSREEVDALKRLASVADKLIALMSKKDSDKDLEEEDDEEEEIDVDIDDDDDDEEDKKKVVKEEIVNTEKCKSNDSIKKSAVSIEKKVKTVDADEDVVAIAWANRYGGQR